MLAKLFFTISILLSIQSLGSLAMEPVMPEHGSQETTPACQELARKLEKNRAAIEHMFKDIALSHKGYPPVFGGDATLNGALLFRVTLLASAIERAKERVSKHTTDAFLCEASEEMISKAAYGDPNEPLTVGLRMYKKYLNEIDFDWR